jgi:hypothetical protein
MYTAQFSRSTSVENLFLSMAKLTEANEDLSRQVKDLFNTYFHSVFYDEENLSDDEDQKPVME